VDAGSTRHNETNGRTMSKNATFDEVLAIVFGTLDTVYQLHGPEDPDNEDNPGNCKHCNVEFPCKTEEIIFEGLAHVSLAMEAAKNASSAESEQPSA